MPTRNQRKEAILAGLKDGILKSRDEETHSDTWVADQGKEVFQIDGALYLETVTESILTSLERQEEASREEAIAAIKALGRSFGQFQTIPPSPLTDQAVQAHAKQEELTVVKLLKARAAAGTLYERQPDGKLSAFILDLRGRRRSIPPLTFNDLLEAEAALPLTVQKMTEDAGGLTVELQAGPRAAERIRKFQNREYPFNGPQGEVTLQRCAAHSDGDCVHKQCPQLQDGEPGNTGRRCPLITEED